MSTHNICFDVESDSWSRRKNINLAAHLTGVDTMYIFLLCNLCIFTTS